MPLRRPQAVAWLAAIMVAVSLVLVPSARSQDTSPSEGFCQVWAAEVIAPIIGAQSSDEVHPSSLSDSCQWWVNPVVPRSHDPNAPWPSAIIGWEDQSLERFIGDHPDGHSAQIGSAVGWYDDGSLLLPVNDGHLYIGVVPAPGVDAEVAVMTLAELAMSQVDTLPAPPSPIPAALFSEGFCGLWSPDELAGILGAPVTVFPDTDSCFWASSDAADPSVSLWATWGVGTLDDAQSSYPNGHEVPIGPVTGWFAQDMGLWVPMGGGLLWITVQPAPDLDQEQAGTALGELALGRASTLPMPPTPEPTLPRRADPVADGLCALWSPDELTQALGTAVEGSRYANRCTWSNDATEPLLLDAYWDDATLEQRKSDYPSGHDVIVGATTGWLTGGFYERLYLPLRQGLLAIALSGAPPAMDPEATVRGLAELALVRSDTLPAPSTPAPTVPVEGDPELEALAPTSVRDETLRGFSYRGARQFASRTQEELQPLAEAVAAVGKTLDDVSILWRADRSMGTVIYALRIRDSDITTVIPVLIDYWFLGEDLPQQTASIAGKAVTALTFPSGAHTYIYAHDDVMWTIRANEPALSEIIGALP